MNDALCMRRFECSGDLHSDVERLVGWNRTLRDAIGERRPFDELHDERRRAVTALETIYMSDVQVIERREHFGFALKAREPIASLANDSGRTLIATSRFRLVSVARYTSAHTARADRLGDLIRTETSVGT